MSAQIECTRTGCQNNENGFCKLDSPLLVKKEAFTDCLSHENK